MYTVLAKLCKQCIIKAATVCKTTDNHLPFRKLFSDEPTYVSIGNMQNHYNDYSSSKKGNIVYCSVTYVTQL